MLLIWYRSVVTCALTILTSSQAILIVWSKRAGKYEYSVTTANFLVMSLFYFAFLCFILFIILNLLLCSLLLITIIIIIGRDFKMCYIPRGLG
jgi:hypothetical protein